jgi:uncharacterized protein YbjT (DUF2867 family)
MISAGVDLHAKPLRILLIGASGFIGSHVLAALIREGHQLRAIVRDPRKLQTRFPAVEIIEGDMNRDTSEAVWLPRLAGINTVINCAGVLHSRHGQSAAAVHAVAPIALFNAASKSGVKKIIQLSAVGTDAATEFARTKRAADEHLATLDVDWTILRPSIVYGRVAYGGTAMLRALAASPFRVPVIGDGNQSTTPIHVSDLCQVMLRALDDPGLNRKTIYPCGPETMTLADMLQAYRGWLGLPPARVLSVPLPLLRIGGRIGDVIGTGPITSTAIGQLEHGTACDPAAYQAATGLRPMRFAQSLANEPAGTADLWHARLYLLRPLIRASLVLLWLESGIAGLLAPVSASTAVLAPLGFSDATALLIARAASLLDLAIALALLLGYRLRSMATIQIAIVAAYTIGLTLLAPSLWLEPFGSLLKNIPVLALLLVHRIAEEER